jgi:hypothetical protein
MTRIQHPSQQELAKFAESSRAIGEFLKWVEQKKGLLLCGAYKPKYAWYTPTATSHEELLTDFLARESMAREPARPAPVKLPDSRTATTTSHGRPSRRAMLVQGK